MIGSVPWGTHFCVFYETQEDLIDILVPYFKAGLATHEFCVWVTSEPGGVDTARAQMAAAMPEFSKYMEKGQIEIISCCELYAIDGAFDPEKSLEGWAGMLRKVTARGFSGLRLTGNAFWQDKSEWEGILECEREINDVVENHDVIAVCAYSLSRCDAGDALDVIGAHQFALIRSGSTWKIVESPEHRDARKAVGERERLRKIIEASPLPAVVYDDDKVYCINKMFTEVFGYTIGDVPTEEAWWPLAYPDERYRELVKIRWYVAIDEAVKYETSIAPQEFAVTCKDGSIKQVMFYFTSIGDLNLVILNDVSRQRRSENQVLRLNRELKQKIQELQTLFDVLPAGIGIAEDPLASHIKMNRAFAEMLELPADGNPSLTAPEPLKPHNFKVYRDGIELTGLDLPIQQVAATGIPIKGSECEVRFNDGRSKRLLGYVEPLSGDNGVCRGSIGAFIDITRMREAEKALRESESRLSLAQKAGKVGVFDWDLTTNETVWSPEMEDIFGVPSGQCEKVYDDWASRVYPEDLQRVERFFLQWMLSGRDAEECEYRFTKNDEMRWVSFKGRIFYGTGGKPLRMIGTIVDITERKQAEEKVRQSEARLMKAQRLAKVGDWEWMAGKDEVVWSKELYDIFGRDPELPPPGYRERPGIYTPESWARLGHAVKRALTSGESYELELELVREDGRTKRWIIARGEAVRNDDGRVIGLRGTVQDITERKRAEEERERFLKQLEMANDDLSSILKITTIAISTLNTDKLYKEVLRQLVDVMGSDMATLLLIDGGMLHTRSSFGLEEAVNGHFSMPVGECFAGAVASTGNIIYVENAQIEPLVISPYIKKAGIRSMLGVPIKRGDKVIGVVHFDWKCVHLVGKREYNIVKICAERFAMAIENAALYKQMSELQNQTQLYLDLMGHDINNMNMVAAGFLEMARSIVEREGRLDDKNANLLDKAITSINNSTRLISNVRKLQRGISGGCKPEIYDLGVLIEEVAAQYKSVPGKSVKITTDTVLGIRVEANELLNDVFDNLIGNAIKHSAGPAFINIRMAPEEKDCRRYCMVTIEDNGPGILEELKDQIFDRLRRGETKAKGSGLGLYLVKSLVESYGGRVWAEDRVKGDYTKGARFVVTLPAVDQ
jgi:PAS domain S-box-containing protein